MSHDRRARMIIDHVESRDERWGRSAPPRSEDSDKPSRIISDDPRWFAQVTRGDQTGPNGELWDLIQLFVFDELRMTAIYRGEDLELRLFKPGAWEPIFTIKQFADRTPVVPY